MPENKLEKSGSGQDKDDAKLFVFVNGDKHYIDSDTVAVRDLIILGGGTPGEYELQLRKGERGPIEQTYANPDQIITVHKADHFTTRFTGPINPA